MKYNVGDKVQWNTLKLTVIAVDKLKGYYFCREFSEGPISLRREDELKPCKPMFKIGDKVKYGSTTLTVSEPGLYRCLCMADDTSWAWHNVDDLALEVKISNPFKVGDIVRLRSGIGNMTVYGVYEEGCHCIWESNRQYFEKSFMHPILVLCGSEQDRTLQAAKVIQEIEHNKMRQLRYQDEQLLQAKMKILAENPVGLMIKEPIELGINGRGVGENNV
jgi:uncharacterized protein YodC (DUF2158 family)